MREKTLAILKPDAVKAKHVGEIIAFLETEGFVILDLKMIRMEKEQAEGFYAVHRERHFFSSLIRFMTSGPVVAMVMERENAISHLRQVMGSTDPAQAGEGSIRRRFATSVEKNAIHGSDSADSAAFEIGFLFPAGGPPAN